MDRLYVLGELDQAGRIEIERLIETSNEARALVEELSVAAMTLKDELAPMTSLTMSPEQRAAVESAMLPAPKRWIETFPMKWEWGLAAVAAVLLLVLALPKNRDMSLTNGKVPDSVTEGLKASKSSREEIGQTSVPQTAVNTVPPSAEEPKVRAEPDTQSKLSVGTLAGQAPVAVSPVMSPSQVARLLQSGVAGTVGGALNGNATDASGARIPGVKVTATNKDTGAVSTVITNETGDYNFPSLTPGKYEVAASLPGFQTTKVSDLEVRETEQKRRDFPLSIAAQATLVGVSIGADQLLSTSGASISHTSSNEKIQNLPLVSSNVLDLIQNLPAVATTRDGLSVTDGRFQPAAPPVAQGGAPAAGGRGGTGAGRGGGGQQAQQGQQGQAQGQGQRVGGPGGGGARGAAAPTSIINPDLVGEIRQNRESGPAAGKVVAAAPPPPPPSAGPGPAGRVNNFFIDAPNTEAYDRIVDNPFIRTTQENLATFSIDVDTASYANMRRFLTQNQMPPRDSVRIEEMINYFNYDYAQPTGSAPIAPNMEVAATPWNPQSRLVRIGIKAREINANRRPPSNLVFLIDVSGSMNTPLKLPLVKAGLKMMVDRLGENDTVSIVVYAGASGLVLPPTSAIRKEVIQQAIDNLQPGGSTNGASGIQLAYNQAVANFIRGGTNRVILMTDGDFNVGVTNQGELTRLIEERAKSGVFLSVLGFGMGNIKDSTLEKLADQGNGHYACIDNLNEARKVLVEEMDSTLVTVAKDVKIQVDFNPGRVEAYRLIGYENRVLRTEDFNNDAKDAGDMGAGHTVTALFEVVPKGGYIPGPSIDPSKYTLAPNADQVRIPAGASNEMLTLRVRYKQPDSDTSTRMDVPLVDRGTTFARATTDFRFAASVAEFGMILRDSPYRGNASIESVLDFAQGSRGQDRNGYRQEFIDLVQRARRLR